MLYPGSIGTVHGHGGVVEGRQQILPHIPHLSGVLFQAHKDKPQMVAVQFHELGLHHLGGLVIACNADEPALAAHGIHQQFQHLTQYILIIRVACNQSLEVDLPRKILLIQGAVVFPFGFRSGGHVRKERISLTQVSIVLICSL